MRAATSRRRSAGELDVDASPADGVLGPSRWTDIYKPTIAAVNGVAYAGGLEWACWTDMAIADEHATFGVTCRRWNIGLADGGTQRLTRILGYRRAIELIVTGRVIDAREAERIGLVNEVVPSGTCVQRAIELAQTIAALPQPALRSDLEAARTGQGRPLDDGLRIEAQCFNRSIFGARNLRRPTPIQRTRPSGPSRRHRTGHARPRRSLYAFADGLTGRSVQPLELTPGAAFDQQRDVIPQGSAFESGVDVADHACHG